MFSGGLDSSLIAYICGSILPKNEEIDLLSLSFSG
jgi:asparagine synthetase B (glutamine-hydrolysing)